MHYGNQSRRCLMGGGPLCPPAVPRPVTWPPNLQFWRWGSSGPSSLMETHKFTKNCNTYISTTKHTTTKPCAYYMGYRDYFQYAPSQSETTLHCNIISHWLGAYTKWSLGIYMYCTEIILDMGSANERHCYKVTLSLIGWAHTQNDRDCI